MVAGGCSDHTAPLLVVGKLRHEVDPAADFEGADRLVVLVFNPGFRPDQRIECWIAVQRGRLQVRADPLARREHVIERRNDRRRCRLGPQPKDTYWKIPSLLLTPSH